MAKIEKFEDIGAWKNARILSKNIYTVTNKDSFSKDFSLKDQIRRAVVSIAANIAEGFERGGNKEFIQYLFIAKASSAEVRSLLYVALDCKYINEAEFEELKNKCIEISKLIQGFISYLKNSELKGSKFSEPVIEYN